jgi:arylformamidase
LYDITVPTHPQLPVWPGGPKFELSHPSKMSEGAICNVSNLSMSVHTGTHIDSPLHFVDGAITTNEIPLNQLVGDCVVAELPGRSRITPADLDSLNLPAGTKKLIFKTDNSQLWSDLSHPFYEDYCALTTEAAKWVRDFGIHLLGIDYLSVSLFADPPEIVHQILLEAGMVLMEGLNLTGVPEGDYRVTCLPFKIENAEGAPARVILEG